MSNEIRGFLNRPVKAIHIAGLVFLFAVIACPFIWINSYWSDQAMHWPTISGKLLDVHRIEYLHSSYYIPRIGTILGWKRSKFGYEQYKPFVEYEYTVNGVKYLGHRVGLSGDDSFSTESEIIGKYRTGMDVSVHYDPQNPANSVLEPQSTIVTRYHVNSSPLVTASVLALSFGIAVAIGFSRRRRADR